MIQVEHQAQQLGSTDHLNNQRLPPCHALEHNIQLDANNTHRMCDAGGRFASARVRVFGIACGCACERVPVSHRGIVLRPLWTT